MGIDFHVALKFKEAAFKKHPTRLSGMQSSAMAAISSGAILCTGAS